MLDANSDHPNKRQDQRPVWLKDYPFSSRYFELTSGHKLHYVDEGPYSPLNPSSKETIVFIHGNPTWSYYFRHPIQQLAGAYRCLALDHIGMGFSDRPQDQRHDPAHGYSYRLQERVSDMTQWLNALEISSPIHLVMHDWGGMIGMSWAVNHPEKVKSITLLNTAAFRLPTSKPMPWQLRMSRSPFGELMVRGLNGFCLYAVNRCSTKPLPTHAVDAYLKPYRDWGNRRSIYHFVKDIPLNFKHPTYDTVVDTEKKLKNLKDKPIMIVFGLKDFVFDKHFYERWKDFYPEAEYHTYPDAGHFILEDEAADVTGKIEGFIRTTTK